MVINAYVAIMEMNIIKR